MWLIDWLTYDAKLQAQTTVTYPWNNSSSIFILPAIVGRVFCAVHFSFLSCWKFSVMSCKKGKKKAKTECLCTADRIWLTLSRFRQSISPMSDGIRNRVMWPGRNERTDCTQHDKVLGWLTAYLAWLNEEFCGMLCVDFTVVDRNHRLHSVM